jgi:hypothetical protein
LLSDMLNTKAQKIRQVIDDNIVDIGHPIVWLADTYDTIPNFDFHPLTPGVEATIADEIADDWRSPFIGKWLSSPRHIWFHSRN